MSRLDRLVLLLDTGTPVVRNTAAEQLAQVQKAHPHELHNLLGRVVPYLKSAQWDTRSAAARAIGGILDHVDVFDPDVTSIPNDLRDVPDAGADKVAFPDEDTSKDHSLASHKQPKMEDVVGDLDAKFAIESKLESASSSDVYRPEADKFTFESFDVINVIKNGKPLLGSAGKEYDWSTADLPPEERLARAKLSVTSRLGLGAEYMEKDFLSEQDLSMTPAGTSTTNGLPQHISMPPPLATPDSDLASPSTPSAEENMSARQRNMMKRKAKMGGKPASNKVRVVDVSTSAAERRASQDEDSKCKSTPATGNQVHKDYFSITPQPHDGAKIVVEHKPASQSTSVQIESTKNTNGWPLDGLVELLIVDIFDPKWETRHGAALALREVLKVHAPGAGRRHGRNKQWNLTANKVYLDDLACRLCCIFALDRFGDYVSDQVIAPIRETVSQTLAALLRHLSATSVKATFDVLTTLVFQPNLSMKAWEVTHGGMLGMKYLVAIRKDVLSESPELLDRIAAAVLHGLADHDDDVRAVGAATLIPIAHEFVENRSESVSHLLDVLWSCLAELRDDLSASTGSVMDLLAKLCSIPEVLAVMEQKSKVEPDHSFATLVPRLYPFLRHTITSVRRAVLRALQTFLSTDVANAPAWIDARFLRLMFQNLLVEQNPDVLQESLTLWCQCIDTLHLASIDSLVETYGSYLWQHVALTMTPIGHGRFSTPLDTSFFIKPSGQSYKTATLKREPTDSVTPVSAKPGRRKREEASEETKFSHNIDSPMLRGDLELLGFDLVLKSRITAATALGMMLRLWPEANAAKAITELHERFSKSPASSPRYLTSIIIQEFASSCKNPDILRQIRIASETALLEQSPEGYPNLIPLLHVVRAQCQALCNAFMDNGRVPASKIPSLAIVCVGDSEAGPSAFSIAVAEKLIGEDFDRLCRSMSLAFKGPPAALLQDARTSVSLAIDAVTYAKCAEDIRVSACRGAVIIATGELPKKLNPILKALMDSIKKEENVFMQRRAANSLASLVALCSASGRMPAADKLIKNLCAFLCVDTSETPEFHKNSHLKEVIYCLEKPEDTLEQYNEQFAREAREAKVKHIGAQMALEEMATRFGKDLFVVAPKLSDCIFSPLARLSQMPDNLLDLKDPSSDMGQSIIDGLCILRALTAKFDPELAETVLKSLPNIMNALLSDYSTIRHAAASCFAHICKANSIEGMKFAVANLMPMLLDAGDLQKRQGAMEALNFLVRCMDVQILPYVIFLIVPVLGRMSDSNNDIRILATTTFALLVKLVPLEAGIPDPPGFSEEMLISRDNERKFIQQMLDGSKVEPFEIPVAIKANLRSYQQEGVNWLAFLNKYQLHGILCDDMGLGKTLQTICIIASDHHIRASKFQESSLDEFRSLPSIIVCPPSLSGHWQHELNTYAPFLRVATYVGLPVERKAQRAKLEAVDVIVTSYDIARNDIEFLSKKNFNYCVLDEGHIIKNAKAKLTQAVKLLQANHRLILSGTPIQNNVLELWSLFDFLMPGFLGTEKTFHDRYAKPIANSRDSKSSSREQEAGALALEALHKQVLPFLLRRLKEDVLADLPPKIIQDYYCDLSPLQKSLYNEFASSQASMVAQETAGDMKKENKTHVFQALQYMRKLCNHPSLVMNENHPKYTTTVADLAKQNQKLKDVQHSPKLLALRDLLLDCGIGAAPESLNGSSTVATTLATSVVNQHRALIFCQIKDMLDMVENDVLKKLLPSVSYMRLDGTTDPRNRQAIVQEFNADPSIDVLLLTTHVGGLGLNLTGADTVIFVEHDWNPMKDLQAMDRAHRIGQKKTVNVYRLITRGTLEEKIMGLQKFKINIASTIVNQQNSGLSTMETDQILDLFNIAPVQADTTEVDSGGVDSQGNVIKKGQTSVFDDLEALHNEDEYADFDVDAFVSTL